MSDDDDDSLGSEVSYAGVVVDGALLLLVSARLFVHWRDTPTSKLTPRKIFHLLVWLGVALELPTYVEGILTPQQTRGTYACHMSALAMFMAAFSVVILVWKRTVVANAATDQSADLLLRALCIMNGSFFVVTLVAGVRLLSSDGTLDHWVETDPLYEVLLLFDAFLLLFNALGLLAYGVKLQLKLTRHPSWGPLATTARVSILMKLNSTMLGCAACFLLRLVMVVLLLAGRTHYNQLFWFALVQWVPSVVPTMALLFMMRTPDDAPRPAPASGSPMVQAHTPLLDPVADRGRGGSV